MTQEPSSGWYPDPAGSGDYRYWDGVAWSQEPVVSQKCHPGKHKVSSLSALAGLLIAVSPVVFAFIGSLGSGASMFNEGSGSGAVIWLLVLSVPTGLVVAGIGALVGSLLQSKANKRV